MLQQLINHSPDIKQLWDEGLVLEFRENHLLIHDIPYLNSKKEIKYGTLVSTLNFNINKTCKPETHVVYFIGEEPCDKNGGALISIINSKGKIKLTEKLTVNFLFSSKPKGGYQNYFEKMMTYAIILSSPAKSIDETVTEKKHRIIESVDSNSVFNYSDTNSSRAVIGSISQKLNNLKIAIIGLGGTGSYILDFISKTEVEEIHLFDGDIFIQHNAFRAPGAASIEELKERMKKTEYFKRIYSKMHRNVISHDYFITKDNLNELHNMDFIFISIDKGEAKKLLIEYLPRIKIPFIDVGMGIQRVDDKLIGILAISSCTNENIELVKQRINFSDDEHNEYKSNIQIAELNALNATLAIIKWKKLFGVYQDLENEFFSTYSINVNKIISEKS
jgi:tRNA A37 threonylcarbamoyladenosine dehydratase